MAGPSDTYAIDDAKPGHKYAKFVSFEGDKIFSLHGIAKGQKNGTIDGVKLIFPGGLDPVDLAKQEFIKTLATSPDFTASAYAPTHPCTKNIKSIWEYQSSILGEIRVQEDQVA